jgi:Fe-S-cluster containining protein
MAFPKRSFIKKFISLEVYAFKSLFNFAIEINKMLKPNLNELGKLAKDTHIETKKYFDKLKKKTPKNLDYVMQDLHDAEFKKTDCLECANCCKTTGPLFTAADIERISKSFRQKPQQFIDQYLRIDEDKDYVLKSVPCTFLDSDNKCFIYDVRPKACREFPHTDRKKFNQITDLTLLNVAICPAAFNIVEKMKAKMPL